MVRWNSPYINHFTQPDSIIPDQTNPQSWDRYSYVNNNPLRYTDTTGHRACGAGEKVTCGGHLTNPTKSMKGCSGEDCQGKSDSKKTQPAHASTNITLGLALGSTSQVQDYYGDYENNTNVPYFPGGNLQPNTCIGPGALICLASFFVSLVPPAENPRNPTNNFFLTFNMTYDEGKGITVSNFQWSNRYNGPAVFKKILINDRTVPVDGGSYMPHDGVYRPIYDSGGSSATGINIQAVIFTVIDTPNGSDQWPYPLSYTVPSIP